MSPSEIEEYLLLDPVPKMRVTLASGDQVVVRNEDHPFVAGLVLVLRGDHIAGRITNSSRLVSIPNIVLLEPFDLTTPRATRRRRQ